MISAYWLIPVAIGFFVFGVLFGRKNKKISDTVASTASTVATKVESAVEKKTS